MQWKFGKWMCFSCPKQNADGAHSRGKLCKSLHWFGAKPSWPLQYISRLTMEALCTQISQLSHWPIQTQSHGPNTETPVPGANGPMPVLTPPNYKNAYISTDCLNFSTSQKQKWNSSSQITNLTFPLPYKFCILKDQNSIKVSPVSIY